MYADSVMTPAGTSVDTEEPGKEDEREDEEQENVVPFKADVQVGEEVDCGNDSSPFGLKQTAALVKDLSSLSVRELRKACEEHGLPCEGRKLDLVDRLTEMATSRVDKELPQLEAPMAVSPQSLWV